MPTRDAYRALGSHEHRELLQHAVQIDQGEDPFRKHPVQHTTHTVKKVVEVPYEDKVRVPVRKKVPRAGVEQKVMRGVELVPVRKYKDVEETVIEVQEEEVRGIREVWVRKKVPYSEIVKKPVKVTRVHKVPYTDYEEREVHVRVEVPCGKVEMKTGYRDDRVLKTKLVEVEQDVTIEHRPALHSEGPLRIRELGRERHHGVVEHGRSVLRSRPMSARPPRHRAQSDSGTLSDALEWTVRLRRPGGQILGVRVDVAKGGASLLVQNVERGLLHDWNSEHPGREVCAGDRIVAANGFRGDAYQLMQILSERSGNLEMLVQSRVLRAESARSQPGVRFHQC